MIWNVRTSMICKAFFYKTTMENKLTISNLFSQDKVKNRFNELLGSKSAGFITSVMQVTQNNTLLSKADPKTIMTAAATAAALDLPINQDLGFAWIVPYKGQAQFQIGWKGFVQLALRTGQYKHINVINVYKNQLNSFNRLTESLDADFSKAGEGEIIGYAGYFELNNGMSKTVYWTKDEVTKHAKKYSKAFSKSFSPWSDKDQFHEMAKKTVLKNMLSKWGILSIDMQTAQLSDQSVQSEEGEFKYIDNEVIDVEVKEEDQVLSLIEISNTEDELSKVYESLDDEEKEKYKDDFSKKKKEINS